MSQFLADARAWALANPWIWPLVLMVISLGIAAASKNPRLRGVANFFAAIGIDAPKLTAAIRQIVTGQEPPPPPSSGGDPGAGGASSSGEGGRSPNSLMRMAGRLGFAIVALVVCWAVALNLMSCSAADNRKFARSALDATAIACVLLSKHTDEAEVAKACAIADDVRPFLRELLAGKAAAAGPQPSSDAGDQ